MQRSIRLGPAVAAILLVAAATVVASGALGVAALASGATAFWQPLTTAVSSPGPARLSGTLEGSSEAPLCLVDYAIRRREGVRGWSGTVAHDATVLL